MSTYYGGPGYKPYYGPTGKVDFGWIGEAWEIYKRTWSVWVPALLIYGVMGLAIVGPFEYSIFSTSMHAAMTTRVATPPRPGMLPPGFDWRWMAFMSVGSFVVNLFLSSSFLIVALKAVRRLPVTFSDAFSGAPVMGRMFVLGVLLGVIGIVGGYTPLLMGSANPVGWIIYGLMMLFYLVINPLLMAAPAIIADGGGALPAIAKSIGSMKRSYLSALLFIIGGGLLLGFLSVITCYIGFLVTIPMGYIIIVLAYRDMVGMEGIQEPGAPYQPMYAPPQQGTWPPPPSDQAAYGQQSPSPYGQYPGAPPPQGYGQQPPPAYGQQPGAPRGQYPPPTPPGYGQQSPPGSQEPPNPGAPSDWPNQPPSQ